MWNDSGKKYYLLGGAVGVVVIGALVCFVTSRSTHSASANDTSLRDLPDSIDAHSASQAPRPAIPLASIPWKRDGVTFTATSVITAQLPWVRETAQPESVELTSAQLPWTRVVNSDEKVGSANTVAARDHIDDPGLTRLDVASLPWDQQRLASYTPVFVELGDLPWRH